MKTIYKYELRVAEGDQDLVTIPGEVLSVQNQNNVIVLWVLGDSDRRVRRTLRVVGTGWDTNVERFTHRGTVQIMGFAWHIFEKDETA